MKQFPEAILLTYRKVKVARKMTLATPSFRGQFRGEIELSTREKRTVFSGLQMIFNKRAIARWTHAGWESINIAILRALRVRRVP